MPGRPQLAAMEAEIKRQGGDEVIFDRIAAGDKIRDIMADYGAARNTFYTWLKAKPGRKEAYDVAKEASADNLVEEGLEILDDMSKTPGVTPAEVSLADKRAGYRRWLAGVRKAEYGDKPAQVNVGLQLNAGDAFLEALKATGLGDKPTLTAEPVDVKVLEAGDGESDPG